MSIAIIDYQMGNLRSVQKAFEKVGIANAIEFVIASNPASAVIEKLPQSTVTATHFEFVFRRRASLQGYVPVAQYSIGLAEWTTAIHGQPVENPVEIIIAAGGETGVDIITVKIPKALAPSAKLFARLQVTGS